MKKESKFKNMKCLSVIETSMIRGGKCCVAIDDLSMASQTTSPVALSVSNSGSGSSGKSLN